MIRVAIVEDSKTIRESLKHFVQTDPECRCVFACATAEEALVGIVKHQPEVVLMDIQLPKLSGIDCTVQIKKILPAVQIIMVTVYEDTDRISAALRAGACGYLLKRCTPAELVSAVREARMGGVPMPREIARKTSRACAAIHSMAHHPARGRQPAPATSICCRPACKLWPGFRSGDPEILRGPVRAQVVLTPHSVRDQQQFACFYRSKRAR